MPNVDTIPDGYHPNWIPSQLDTIPNEHDPEWTRSRMDTIPNGHDPEWTRFRMGTIPNEYDPEWTRSRMSTYVVTQVLCICLVRTICKDARKQRKQIVKSKILFFNFSSSLT